MYRDPYVLGLHKRESICNIEPQQKTQFSNKSILFILCLFFSLSSSAVFALSFQLPKKAGDNIVGVTQTAEVLDSEDFEDISFRHGVGYYEIVEANPGMDPDNPPKNTAILIPTQYILPEELVPNLILINLAEMRLYYIPTNEKVVYIFPVGIGKVDWDTPTGKMRIVRKVANPTWTVPDKIYKLRVSHGEILPRVMPAGEENPLGSYAMRLSYGDYLIHGTNLPSGVGRRSSAGCIRLYEQDIKKLFSMVAVNTPVLIINQPYKAGWLNGKLYLEAHMPLFEQRLEAVAGDMSQVIEVLDAASQNRKVVIDWEKAFKFSNEHLDVPRVISK